MSDDDERPAKQPSADSTSSAGQEAIEGEDSTADGMSRRTLLGAGVAAGIGGLVSGGAARHRTEKEDSEREEESEPEDSTCPKPKTPPPHGTVNVSAPPPLSVRRTHRPPWKDPKRPAPGSKGEIPWFNSTVTEMHRHGPRFGPRKHEFLPYLLIRAASGDRGSRPVNGVFWESPDVLVAPNQDAATAPLMPTAAGGVAEAGKPNTLYAHVWNLGKSPVYRARVEFYWFNPSLALSRSAANLVGVTYVDLDSRFSLHPSWTEVNTPYGRWLSRGSHAIVHCPSTWEPAFVNGGHECLIVRVSDPILDPVPLEQFGGGSDRHVAQRNIAVVQAASPATLNVSLDLGWHPEPGVADVRVELAAPRSMEWLRIYTQRRDPGFIPPASSVTAGLLPPSPKGAARQALHLKPGANPRGLLSPRERFHLGCDRLEIALHASCKQLRRNEAQVVRVFERLDGHLVGGYSVVLIGRQRRQQRPVHRPPRRAA